MHLSPTYSIGWYFASPYKLENQPRERNAGVQSLRGSTRVRLTLWDDGLSRQIGKVRSSTHMDGFRVNQDLYRSLSAVGLPSKRQVYFETSFSAASFWAVARASAAGTFTSGSTPVPSQLVLLIGLMARAKGTPIMKWSSMR